MAATADRIDRVSVWLMADLLGVTVEEYAARRVKNSPGQMSLWDDNATESNLLRSSARQKSFDWDESKHPRAEDGKFAEAGAAGKSGGGGAAVAEADEDEPEESGEDEDEKDPPAKPTPEPEPEDEPSPIAPPEPDPAKTPRENAEAAQRKLDADYEFARASAISNAGEDLKGSARHIRNQWRTLEDAETEGIADHLVTRDQLLKNEPHSLAMHAESNPVGSLMLHEVLRAFPPKPGYGSRNVSEEAAKKNRANYLDVYRKVKSEAEKIAASGENQVQDISRAVGKIVADEIRRLRTTEGKTDDTANGLVNYYGSLSKFWQKSSIATKVSGFLSEAGITDPDSPDGKAADIALQVMEGKTFSQILGKEKGPAKPKGFSEAELYVATAERIGGPKLPVKTAKESLDYLIGKVGLRGVQFGNSVSDAEREHHAKMSAGAMLDLADVTGLPLEAVSLDGKLGLAMGARGKGNALAHYEPGTKVINLTRKGGVGSLAHEWGHAFDNIISADYARKNTPYLSEDAFPPETPVSGAMKSLRIAWDSSGYKSRLRSELQKRINNKTMTAKRANDYWNTNLEIFARSFERHIQRKLEKGGRKSTYLAGIESKAYKSGGLWPTDEEVDKMAPEFDRLFDAYREHGLKIADRVKYSAIDRDRLADRFIAEVLGMTVEQYNAQKKEPEVTTGKHGDRGRYVTTDNGSQIFLTTGGEIGQTGKKIGGGETVDSAPQSPPVGDSPTPPQRKPPFVQSFADSIMANIRKNAQDQQYDQPAGPAPESHPHHHSKLPPQLRQSLLNWSADIERLAQPIGWARHGAGVAGDGAKGVMRSAFDEINKAELSKVFQKLDGLIAAGQQEGVDLRPFVKHNNLVPRTIAAKLKPSDLFHPVQDEERYAARQVKVERYDAKNCGANASGGGGFQAGNTCSSSEGGQSGTASKQKPLSFDSKIGDSFAMAEYGLKASQKITVKEIEGAMARVVGENGMTATVPTESLEQLYMDTTGDYTPMQVFGESKSSEVNKIIAGKAKFIGKGADGVVHDVGGGMVVKSSTTVPYHAVGGGQHLTVNEAVELFAAKINLEKEMHAAGIPGVMKTKNGMHGDKIFSIRPKLDVDAKLSDSQIKQLESSIAAMHKAGYTINDEVQVGIGEDDNVYHYDLGQASSGAHPQDIESDLDRLRAFKEENAARSTAKQNPEKYAAAQSPAIVDRFIAQAMGISVEEYAARRAAKSSPGQLGLWDDNATGSNLLRTSARQKSFDWDESKVKRDPEGKFAEQAGGASKPAISKNQHGADVITQDHIGGGGDDGTFDRLHAGLASEIVQSKIAIGMKGIEGREYAILQHNGGRWQLVSRPGRKAESEKEKPKDDEKPSTKTMAEFMTKGKSFSQFTDHIKELWYDDKITESEWQSLHDKLPKIPDWADASKLTGRHFVTAFPMSGKNIIGRVEGIEMTDSGIAARLVDADGKSHLVSPHYLDSLKAKIGHEAKKGRLDESDLDEPHIAKVLEEIAGEISDGTPIRSVIDKHFGEMKATESMVIRKAIAKVRERIAEEKLKPSAGRAAAMEKSKVRDATEPKDQYQGDSMKSAIVDRFMAEAMGLSAEQYAARRAAKSSPGQMSLWDDNATGSNLLRTSARQRSFDWDEARHPRADDGKFAELGAGKASGGGSTAKAEAAEEKPEPAKIEPEAAKPEKGSGEAQESKKYAPGVHATIIPGSAAFNAHRGTSFVPEERAKQVQAEFVSTMNGKYEEFSKAAKTDEQKAILEEAWPEFLIRAKSAYMSMLGARGNVMSMMITGPARFPTARNEKKSNTYEKRVGEYLEGLEKGSAAMRRKMGIGGSDAIRIGDKGSGSELEKKLEQLEKFQEKAKQINAAVRKVIDSKSRGDGPIFKKGFDLESGVKFVMETAGVEEKTARGALKPDFAGRYGIPNYALTNNNANMKRVREQIARQEKFEKESEAAEAGEKETEFSFEGGEVHLDYDDNRIRIKHDKKPGRDVIESLKRSGWRWSPSNGAWQRQLTPAAKESATNLTKISFAAAKAKPSESENYGAMKSAIVDRFMAEAMGLSAEQYAARKVKSSPGQQEFDWITVHPNGAGTKGVPVMIDRKDGTIKAGMGGKFDGQKIGEIGGKGGANPAAEKKTDRQKVADHLASNPNATIHDIAKATGLKHHKYGDSGSPTDKPLNKALREMMDSGEIDHSPTPMGGSMSTFSMKAKAKGDEEPAPATGSDPIEAAIVANGGHEANSANDVDAIRNSLYRRGEKTPSHAEIRAVMERMKNAAGEKATAPEAGDGLELHLKSIGVSDADISKVNAATKGKDGVAIVNNGKVSFVDAFSLAAGGNRDPEKMLDELKSKRGQKFVVKNATAERKAESSNYESRVAKEGEWDSGNLTDQQRQTLESLVSQGVLTKRKGTSEEMTAGGVPTIYEPAKTATPATSDRKPKPGSIDVVESSSKKAKVAAPKRQQHKMKPEVREGKPSWFANMSDPSGSGYTAGVGKHRRTFTVGEHGSQEKAEQAATEWSEAGEKSARKTENWWGKLSEDDRSKMRREYNRKYDGPMSVSEWAHQNTTAPQSTPAPAPYEPPTIPGQQTSLFGGDDLNTGQKSLFNMVRPTKADQRAAKRGEGPAPASLLEQIDDDQKKYADGRKSLPGQGDLLGGDGGGGAESGELPQYAVKAGIKSWEQAKKKGLHTAVTESGALANAAAKNVASYLNNPTSIANEAAKLIIERTATLGNMREGVKMVADHFDRMANANREPGHVHYGKFANELRKLNGEFGKEGKMQFSTAQLDRFIERYRAGSSTKKADAKPKTVTGSKGDRGRFITVGEGDAAHPVFLPGSVKKIKETGEYRTDNSQARAKEARKKNKAAGNSGGKFVPVTKIEKSIVETVGDHPDDVREFRSIVDKTYSEMANEARDKIAAIREITAMAGYDRSNAGGFVKMIRAARDYDKIPRFDEMADYARRAFPGVLAPKMKEAGGSHEQALFELLKDGIPEMPDKHSREVMDEAWNRSGYDQTGKPSEWAAEASAQDDDDFVPFSASLAARMSIERYRANPRSGGVPQFMRSR